MLYESLEDSPGPGERPRLTGGCWRALLPASPGDPSEVPFGRYVAHLNLTVFAPPNPEGAAAA